MENASTSTYPTYAIERTFSFTLELEIWFNFGNFRIMQVQKPLLSLTLEQEI